MTSEPIRLLENPSTTTNLRADLAIASEAQLQGLELAAGLARLQGGMAGRSVSAAGRGVSSQGVLLKLTVGGMLIAGAAMAWAVSAQTAESEVVADVAPPAPPPSPPRPVAVAQPIIKSDRSAPLAPVEPSPTDTQRPGSEPHPTDSGPKPGRTIGAKRATKVGSSHSASRTDYPAVDDVIREARMVAKARSSLGQNPTVALELVRRAEAEFPAGQLIEERRSLAIQALVALGRVDEARAQAQPFLAQYERGAHAAAVRRALQTTP